MNKFEDKPGGMKLVQAFVPLAEMFQYVSVLRGMTKGRAQYSMQLERYEVVPPNIQAGGGDGCWGLFSMTGDAPYRWKTRLIFYHRPSPCHRAI